MNIRRLVTNTTMRWAALAVAVTFTLLVNANAQAQPATTTDVDIRVWQRISDDGVLAVSVRPEGRTWAELGTISLGMDHTSASGVYRYDDVATAGVEVRVWQRISDFQRLFISARPEGGSWADLGTIPLGMDNTSASGIWRYGDITLAVPAPEPEFVDQTGVVDDIEYTIALPPGSERSEQGQLHFFTSEGMFDLGVAPQGSVGQTLPEVVEAYRATEEGSGAVPERSLFEWTSSREVTAGGRVFHELTHRSQRGESCVLDTVNRLIVVEGWHGETIGLRVSSGMCAENLERDGELRQAILDSIRVTAAPAVDYTGVVNDIEYAITLPPGWEQTHDTDRTHGYSGRPTGYLQVHPAGSVGQTLTELVESFRTHREWISSREVTVGGQVFHELIHREQSPGTCVRNAVNWFTVVDGWHGATIGLRVSAGMCEEELERYGWLRQVMLGSLRVTAAPAPDPVDHTGVVNDIEYAIALPPGFEQAEWTRNLAGLDVFGPHGPSGISVSVSTAGSPGQTLPEVVESFQSSQEETARTREFELLEWTSSGEIAVGGQVFHELAYRIQQTLEDCVFDVVARFTTVEGWHGESVALQVSSSTCEENLERVGELRQAILDSIRVTAITAVDHTGVVNDIEYAIALPSDWEQAEWTRNLAGLHIFGPHEPSGMSVSVRTAGRPGQTLPEAVESFRKSREDTASRLEYPEFEWTSSREVTIGEQVFHELAYRSQRTLEDCVQDIVTRLTTVEGWHGESVTFQTESATCEENLERDGGLRQAILDSIRVTAAPEPEPMDLTAVIGDIEYTIVALPPRFTLNELGRLHFVSNQKDLTFFISPAGLVGQTLPEVVEGQRTSLEERNSTAALFEWTSSRDVTVEGQVFRELAYRSQQTLEEGCVYDYVVRLTTVEAWHGETVGLMISSALCEEYLERDGELRQAIFDSLRVTAAPPPDDATGESP